MCDSISIVLPRTQCENVLFSRVRLLFGVVVEGPIDVELNQFKLSVAEILSEGSIEQLNKAKDYLLAASGDATGRKESRPQYGVTAAVQIAAARDSLERESSAVVRVDESGRATVVGNERSVAIACAMMDEIVKGEDVAAAREAFRSGGKHLESEDSSYDSDCEGGASGGGLEAIDPHHDDVSRTVSDTLAAEFAEYVTRPDPNYTARVEFALKLGYTERQVQVALQKLGARPSQNELLAELIRLGSAPHQTPTDEEAEVSFSTTDGASIEDPSNLRHIVIDGSNLAMSHGNKEVFSCRGIQICVEWFRARGHQNITVFVPRWRKENSRPDAPIKDQEILQQLERERLLVFTPSRQVGGRRLVCYDDRYVLRLAVDSDGVVVSNDNYRDLVAESPDFKRVVEERLLMYSFVNDRFMPPEDPLGRHGPSLDAFLRKSPARNLDPLPPPCPYGKKCTYGNKCKYHHPERGNQPHKSVTERLAEQAKIPLQEVKARGLKSRESSPGDKLKSSISVPLSGSAKTKKQPLSRTKSLVPTSNLQEDFLERTSVERTKSERIEAPLPGNSCFLPSPAFTPTWAAQPQITLPTDTSNWAATGLTSSIGAEMLLEDSGGHLFVAKRLSDPDNKGGLGPAAFQKPVPQDMTNLHRKLQRQLTLNPTYDPRLLQMGGYAARTDQQQHLTADSHVSLSRMASDGRVLPHHLLEQHQTVTRIASAPDPHRPPGQQVQQQQFNSASDTRLNLNPEAQIQAVGGHRTWTHGLHDPPRPMSSAGMYPVGWPEMSGMARGLAHPVRPSSVPPPGLCRAASPDLAKADNARGNIYYHLAAVFPKEQVQAVMEMYPLETNPKKICAAIVSMFPKG